MIFGVAGQAGSFLTELLLDKGYEVCGVVRRSSNPNYDRLANTRQSTKFNLLAGDVTDYSSVFRLIEECRPDEIYNLAAQSHVKISFDEPIHTTNVVYGGCLNILEAIRSLSNRPNAPLYRFYQASSSEMFGASMGTLYGSPQSGCLTFGNVYYRQNETTPFLPCSPYAIAKLAAHHAVGMYRKSYGLHASCGILFNNESPRRPIEFVTRKITNYVAKVALDQIKVKLELGNLNARRDWGYCPEYMEAAYLILQESKPDDYVIATGETHTVEDFVREAFNHIGKDYHDYIHINKDFFRPNEVDYLCGDASKAKSKLLWKPKTSFTELVKLMVDSDIKLLKV